MNEFEKAFKILPPPPKGIMYKVGEVWCDGLRYEIAKGIATAREEGYRSGIEEAAKVSQNWKKKDKGMLFCKSNFQDIAQAIRHLSTNRDNAKDADKE